MCLLCYLVCSKSRLSALFLVCPSCGGVSVLFSGIPDCRPFFALLSGVSRLCGCARLVFWCVQNMAVCPPCFLLCTNFRGVSALFSDVSINSRSVHLVFCCAQNITVCPPAFWCVQNISVCPPCVQNVVDYPPSFLVCPKCDGVSVLFSGVTKLSRFIHLVLWCVRNGAVCLSCFLV